jgi:hypothetical protein
MSLKVVGSQQYHPPPGKAQEGNLHNGRESRGNVRTGRHARLFVPMLNDQIRRTVHGKAGMVNAGAIPIGVVAALVLVVLDVPHGA